MFCSNDPNGFSIFTEMLCFKLSNYVSLNLIETDFFFHPLLSILKRFNPLDVPEVPATL